MDPELEWQVKNEGDEGKPHTAERQQKQNSYSLERSAVSSFYFNPLSKSGSLDMR